MVQPVAADDNYDLNVAQAAEIMGVVPYTIRRWAKSGRIEAVKTPGHHWRFSRASLERAWLNPDVEDGAA
jgi:excisionase family DNA binding protein